MLKPYYIRSVLCHRVSYGDTFRLSEEERNEFAQLQNRQLEKRNQTLLVISHGDTVLQLLAAKLARPEGSLSSIILPLMLATGRRMTEILSPVTEFHPGPTPYFALFSGQLKKRNTESAVKYVIPLLVPYETLCAAIAAFRRRQRCEGLTNAQIKQRYQGSIRRDFRKVLPFMPPNTTPHSLRALFCEFVFHAFDVPCTKNALIQRVLGHEGLATSLRYGHFRADEVTRGQFGPLLE